MIRAEYRVPTKIVAPCQVAHDRSIAIGYGSDEEALSQPRQSGLHVRPSVEAMPCQGESVQIRIREFLEAKMRQYPFEGLPMQYVEFGIREAPGTHFLHGRLILLAPGIGKSQPVD